MFGIGKILGGGSVEVVESDTHDGDAYEIARLEIEIGGRKSVNYLPVVETDDEIEVFGLESSQIGARDAVVKRNGDDRRSGGL